MPTLDMVKQKMRKQSMQMPLMLEAVFGGPHTVVISQNPELL
jgi:hypothetical protein